VGRAKRRAVQNSRHLKCAPARQRRNATRRLFLSASVPIAAAGAVRFVGAARSCTRASTVMRVLLATALGAAAERRRARRPSVVPRTLAAYASPTRRIRCPAAAAQPPFRPLSADASVSAAALCFGKHFDGISAALNGTRPPPAGGSGTYSAASSHLRPRAALCAGSRTEQFALELHLDNNALTDSGVAHLVLPVRSIRAQPKPSSHSSPLVRGLVPVRPTGHSLRLRAHSPSRVRTYDRARRCDVLSPSGTLPVGPEADRRRAQGQSVLGRSSARASAALVTRCARCTVYRSSSRSPRTVRFAWQIWLFRTRTHTPALSLARACTRTHACT
jgi:hypothetical protein